MEFANDTTDYGLLLSQALALTDGVHDAVANMANVAALLFDTLPDINWAGFYRLQPDGALLLGPFQGKPACTLIGPGKGVCGAAAVAGKTVVVPNVHLFPGHIACDCASNSELVVPLKRADGTVYGVLDIDSPLVERFSQADALGLERFAAALGGRLAGE